MSYSRWSHSCWYTYWCTPQGDAVENRDIARFSYHYASAGICSANDLWFAAAQLREDLDGCLSKVAANTGCSADETAELRLYMQRFLADTDKRYPAAA